MHDDMMKEQRLVVDLNVAREQPTEILHIPETHTATTPKADNQIKE